MASPSPRSTPRPGEIYINPLRRLDDEEWRFVLAHEMLHAALRHGDRRGGRDPYLFNVACDYVINGWLIEMGVGDHARGAAATTRNWTGLSAEEVYDRIATDLRRHAPAGHAARQGAGDILGGRCGTAAATASTSTSSTAAAWPRD